MQFRRIRRYAAIACVGVTIGCLVVFGPALKKRAEYQRKADATEWRWSKEQTRLDYCVKHNLHGYTARVTPREDTWVDKFQVSVLDGAEEVYSFRGHENTVFVQTDDVLYVAKYCPIATGCEIIAYDLKARKELWRCGLNGNGPMMHSEYWHRINIEVDGDAILVFGAEANGRYIEYVDTKSGRTVGHKMLPPDYSLSD